MNYDLLFLVIFGLVVLAIMSINKKRTEIQKIAFPLLYMIIYRTKLGLDKMDKLAKRFPRFLKVVSYISISIGYLGMAFILFFLLKGAYEFLFLNLPSPVGLVLPGVETIPGLPKLSFWHWIITIFILASVHEFSHGVFARLNKIKVKSSGFALLGIILPIIPAAFVEPDEKSMNKASKKAQLSVLSAGSFANFITAVVALLIFGFVLGPVVGNMLQETGVTIVELEKGGPADLAGVQKGESIIAINDIPITNIDDFKQEMDKYSPSEKVSLQTENSTYYVTLKSSSDNIEKSHLGVFLMPKEQIYNPEVEAKYGTFFIKTMIWITLLFSWLFMINLGVGMFNLLPLGFLDGGKMFYLGILHLTKNEAIAKRIFKYTSMFLVLVLLLLILPQLYNTLISPLISFII
jgi:membrane-associated protease RseP (regulator of RpoE activity)